MSRSTTTDKPRPELPSQDKPLRPDGPQGYGKHFFCAEVPSLRKLNAIGRIYFYADRVIVEDGGALLAVSDWPRHGSDRQPMIMLAIQQHEWIRCYAANSLTDEPLVVDARLKK